MHIEKEPIQLYPLNFEQIRISGTLIGTRQKFNLPLKTIQLEILEMMAKRASIESIIKSYLSKNMLISFLNLYEIIHFLLAEDLILNPSFKNYFSGRKPESGPNFIEKLKHFFQPNEKGIEEVKEQLRKVPFLRSLEPEIFDAFTKEMRLIETPAGITVCREGDLQRSLFILLSGEAAVIKRNNSPKGRRLATLTDNSVFGEVGYLMGEPRTADVITTKPSLIVRLKYNPEFFDGLVKKEKALVLQKRFWVIHALLKSQIFSGIPEDCFDAFVFAGQIKTFPANTTICVEGESGSAAYLVVQGSVVVTKEGKTVRVLSQGDSFGEVALIMTQGKRTATVRAQTEVVLLEIPFTQFYQLLSQNLLLACEFEKQAFRNLQADVDRN